MKYSNIEVVKEFVSKIEELKKFYNDNEIGEHQNLKLHYIEFKNDDDFNYFCQCQYDLFIEVLEENNCYTEQLGRTSSFYIHSEYQKVKDFEENLNDLVIFINDYTDIYCSDFEDVFSFLELIKSNDQKVLKGFIEYSKEYTYTKEDLILDFINDIDTMIDNLKDVVKVKEYIKDFKLQQQTIYNEFFEG